MKYAVVLIIILLLLGGGGIWFFLFSSSPVSPVIETSVSSVNENTLLKSVTMIIPDVEASVTLKNGKAVFDIPHSVGEGTIALLPQVTGKFEEGGTTHVAGVFAVDSGGTGQFLYLITFSLVNEVLVQKASLFIGDRIEVSSLSMSDIASSQGLYRIVLKTLERESDEPFANDPSIETERLFIMVNSRTLTEATPEF